MCRMCSKHDLRELKKFVYWRIVCRSRTWLTPNEDIHPSKVALHTPCAEYVHEKWLGRTPETRYLAHDLQPICAEYGLVTWLAPNEGIRALFIYLLPICPQIRFETWLAQNGESYVFTVDLHNICAEYVLETWLARTDEIRVLAFCLYLSLGGYHVLMEKIP